MPIYLPSIGGTGLAHAGSLPAAGQVGPRLSDRLPAQTHAPFADKDIDQLAWMPHVGSSPLENLTKKQRDPLAWVPHLGPSALERLMTEK